MRLNQILNQERVSALGVERNAYVNTTSSASKTNKANIQEASKVIFPQPYENMGPYYNKSEFCPPPKPEPAHENSKPRNNQPMFNLQSMLPMLMSGKFNDVLKPLMGMLSGGGMGEVSKIFELFKPKPKEKAAKKEEDVSSKFDDMIIIED